MKKLSITNDFKSIVLNDTKLIDVRAPIEYEKGAMLNSINLPILSNEERHIIGICYKEKGNDEATRLGYKLVSGNIKAERVNSWVNCLKNDPNTMIYCFRGGSRSTIAQNWIYEATGQDMVKLDGGYKAFRNYLIESLNPKNINSMPLVLTGYTGSGKTILLNKLSNAIDLEGLANHRGSTFGHFITPQPTQINFENNLAYGVIKHEARNYKYMILEDESKNIGKSFIPKDFYNHFQGGDVVFLDCTLEERVENILEEYVVKGQRNHFDVLKDKSLALENWLNDMLASMERVQSKIGGDRMKLLIEELKAAYKDQISTNRFDRHRNWIELFLNNYYDPMYKHSLDKTNRNIIFRGNSKEVTEFLESLE
ncbi:tRNA 2-selenouridine(34) synthase MnmH [Clostridium manihotivorum]|uniref:tRNA 2-selenouridine(34) synthase MnmH n=1 Tax=Clostridium manihotivorum TaxID=2320868 RepID=A0A410DVA9_9CLOT|nr:tRNA 2-selenouridine(34) synthase MnmH [Clostridium manihotivorum]QAA32995.1 tRNA 2-selenouridine(34) synthase MnmH [Clostridium manihotivorum]